MWHRHFCLCGPLRKGDFMSSRRFVALVVGMLVSLSFVNAALAQQTPIVSPKLVVPAAAQPSPQFNADKATEAYLATIPPAAKARSDAYFEGGYWLILWDLLYGVVICWVLLHFRW